LDWIVGEHAQAFNLSGGGEYLRLILTHLLGDLGQRCLRRFLQLAKCAEKLNLLLLRIHVCQHIARGTRK
jgi:hypothetical protein